MKLKLNNSSAFKPVVLEITIETAEELDAMQFVCAYSEWVAEAIHDSDIDADEEKIYQMLNDIWDKLRR